ncbi:hypothetical protein [Novipirellula rosea]|uniref:Uncharacterized protein n=1 Tax=Novipirellula rosea TaxID=1031540 RepID=A0ABP8N445_9BACT
MTKRVRKPNRVGKPGRVGIVHGAAWAKLEWFVPFTDGHAYIYHGHEDPQDHSDCGPHIFCCPEAGKKFLQRFPESEMNEAEWKFTSAYDLIGWMGSQGPKVFYIFFCDPDDPMALRFAGVRLGDIRKVLMKRQSLDSFLDIADCIDTRR